MGRNVAGRYHPAERFDTTHSEGGSAGDIAGLQNQTPCRARDRTATLGSQLANLQTTSHSHVPRVCGEVAAGRSFSTQTLYAGSRQVAVTEAPHTRVGRQVHEGHHQRGLAKLRGAQSNGPLGEVGAQPDCPAWRDVDTGQGRRLYASRSILRTGSCGLRTDE